MEFTADVHVGSKPLDDTSTSMSLAATPPRQRLFEQYKILSRQPTSPMTRQISTPTQQPLDSTQAPSTDWIQMPQTTQLLPSPPPAQLQSLPPPMISMAVAPATHEMEMVRGRLQSLPPPMISMAAAPEELVMARGKANKSQSHKPTTRPEAAAKASPKTVRAPATRQSDVALERLIRAQTKEEAAERREEAVRRKVESSQRAQALNETAKKDRDDLTLKRIAIINEKEKDLADVLFKKLALRENARRDAREAKLNEAIYFLSREDERSKPTKPTHAVILLQKNQPPMARAQRLSQGEYSSGYRRRMEQREMEMRERERSKTESNAPQQRSTMMLQSDSPVASRLKDESESSPQLQKQRSPTPRGNKLYESHRLATPSEAIKPAADGDEVKGSSSNNLGQDLSTKAPKHSVNWRREPRALPRATWKHQKKQSITSISFDEEGRQVSVAKKVPYQSNIYILDRDGRLKAAKRASEKSQTKDARF
jgi:hypothetical protein